MNWKRLSIVLLCLCGLLTLSDVLLLKQNVQMRRKLPVAPTALKAGVLLMPFSARGLTNQKIDVQYDGTGPRRVYFYFTSACDFCRKQFPYWKQILSLSDSRNLEAIGLVKDSENEAELRQFLTQMGCSPDSEKPLKVAFISDDVRRNYGLSATPVTLVADNRGAVEKSWLGAWNDAERVDALTMLKLPIPTH